MQIKGLGKSLTIMGLTTAVLASNINPIQAQSNANLVRLFDIRCVATTGSSWSSDNAEVLTRRELYTSYGYLYGGSGFSCRFGANDNSIYKTLTLKFGLNDQEKNDDVIVNIYLNGNLSKSVKLKRGTVQTFAFDVTKKRTVAIEAICTKKNCSSKIYFYRLHLEKKSPPPKRSK